MLLTWKCLLWCPKMLHAHIWCPKLLLTWNTSIIIFKIASHIVLMSKLALIWSTTMFMSKIAVGLERVRMKPQNVAGYEVNEQKRCMHLNAACVYLHTCCTRVLLWDASSARCCKRVYLHTQTDSRTVKPRRRSGGRSWRMEERSACVRWNQRTDTHIQRTASAHCACQRRTDHHHSQDPLTVTGVCLWRICNINTERIHHISYY